MNNRVYYLVSVEIFNFATKRFSGRAEGQKSLSVFVAYTIFLSENLKNRIEAVIFMLEDRKLFICLSLVVTGHLKLQSNFSALCINERYNLEKFLSHSPI